MPMLCSIPVQFSKADSPYSFYPESCTVVYRDGVWVGHYKNRTITIPQDNLQADVEEKDITITQDTDTTPDPSVSIYFPREKIVQAINKYLDQALD